jgi:hypothetical protein
VCDSVCVCVCACVCVCVCVCVCACVWRTWSRLTELILPPMSTHQRQSARSLLGNAYQATGCQRHETGRSDACCVCAAPSGRSRRGLVAGSRRHRGYGGPSAPRWICRALVCHTRHARKLCVGTHCTTAGASLHAYAPSTRSIAVTQYHTLVLLGPLNIPKYERRR